MHIVGVRNVTIAKPREVLAEMGEFEFSESKVGYGSTPAARDAIETTSSSVSRPSPSIQPKQPQPNSSNNTKKGSNN